MVRAWNVVCLAVLALLVGVPGCGGGGGGTGKTMGGPGIPGSAGTSAGAGAGGTSGGGGGGASTTGPSDRCKTCTSGADCSTNFCNRVASNDLADLLGEPATNLGGRCSAPSDQGRCGCFTGFLSGNELCVGTGCSGTPVSLCDHLSGQELTDAGIGDSGGSAGYFPPCTPLTATAALITDFTSMTGGFGPFDGIGFSGVTFSYPGTIVQSFANMNWNIAGTVSDYSGFGLSLGTCPEVNASAYSGIKFDISGTFALTASEAGTAPTALTFTVGTARDEVASQYQLNFSAADSSTWSFGTCVPASSQFDGSCTDPSTMISVTPTPTTVMLTWDMFGGGKPQSFDPSKITSIGWALPWTGPGGTPYTVNLTLDNIAFF